MTTINKTQRTFWVIFLLAVLSVLGIREPIIKEGVKDTAVTGFTSIQRGFSTLQGSSLTQITYDFAVTDIPTGRAGAASSSTGYEFGKVVNTSATAFTTASTSVGFAVTINESGRVRGCSFELNATPTTGTLSIQIQKNGTLQTGKYCKIPTSGTFATNGGLDDVSTNEIISDEITFVAGDRLGLIASSSNLNAATIDGWAKIIIQISN